MRTIEVRWTPRTLQDGLYEFHDGRKWCPCHRKDWRGWLKEGHVIHMNPL